MRGLILAGGSGTRLWPLSRKSYPKQFAQLTRDHTLLQAAADRVSGAGFAPPIILTQSDFRFIVPEQLTGIGIEPGPVLLEPEAAFEGLFVRKGKMRLWVSEDDRRLITKATIKVPVASLVLKLKEVTGPGDDIWVTKSAEKGPKKKTAARRRRR